MRRERSLKQQERSAVRRVSMPVSILWIVSVITIQPRAFTMR